MIETVLEHCDLETIDNTKAGKNQLVHMYKINNLIRNRM